MSVNVIAVGTAHQKGSQNLSGFDPRGESPIDASSVLVGASKASVCVRARFDLTLNLAYNYLNASS